MMRNLILISLLASMPCVAVNPGFAVIGADTSSAWTTVLNSVGFQPAPLASAGVVVVKQGAACDPNCPTAAAVSNGLVLILEGSSATSAAFGFTPSGRTAPIRREVDERALSLLMIWQLAPATVPIFNVPSGTTVFSADYWSGAPLLVGKKMGSGAILWVATAPGPQTYDRYPYLFQAMSDLGVPFPFQARKLSAFLDYSYRANVDLDYFAAKWRASGLRAIHLSAWYFWDSTANDAWLQALIAACHRHGVLVYMWLELPHVSQGFWNANPQWREKNALLQDAQVYWRLLMNLQNPDCVNAIVAGLNSLLSRANWDGVNLAELYFESLEGTTDLAEFTPLNDNIRSGFQAQGGFDPADLFNAASSRYFAHDPNDLQTFLNYRASVVYQMQTDWIGRISALHATYPALDIVLTTVDDLYDPTARNLLGVDSARLLPLLNQYNFTFTIEDPAELWSLGPQRYPALAALYAPLTNQQNSLAVDINVVARPGITYPTLQQTGLELWQLMRLAGSAFHGVMFYSESSVFRQDFSLLGAASAQVTSYAPAATGMQVTAPNGVGVNWPGPAQVDGQLWPVKDGTYVWLPPGAHTIAPASADPAWLLLDLNADLVSAQVTNSGISFAYSSTSGAIAILNRQPNQVLVDGAAIAAQAVSNGAGGWALALPRGAHSVAVQ
jgi:hypothetical protein